MARCGTCGLEIAAGARFCGNCGDPQLAPVAPPEEIVAELTHGTKLDERYEVLKPLGRGGMGVVYLARDQDRDGSLVALKLLPPELSADTRGLAALKREATLAMRLSHPNIVRMHNLEGRTRKYVTMEYVDGGSLADLIQARVRGQLPRSPDWTGPGLSPSEVAPLLDGIAAGLDYAHAERVIHRDMKPANVMIKRSGDRLVPKVADFGIASELREMVSHFTQKGVAGTPAYMSPEHYRGEKIDARADVYSVAATVYTALAARSPFKGGDLSWQVQHKIPDAIPGVPAPVMAVVTRGMAKQAAGRFESCGALAAAFAAAVKGRHPESDLETVHPTVPTTTPAASQETRDVPASAANTPTTSPHDPSLDPSLATISPPLPRETVPAPEPSSAVDVSAEPTLRPLPAPTVDSEPVPVRRSPGAIAAAVLLSIAAIAGLQAILPRPTPSPSPTAPVTPSVASPSAEAAGPNLGDLINDERLLEAAQELAKRKTLTDADLNDGIGLGLTFFRHGNPKSGTNAWKFVISKRPDGVTLLKAAADGYAKADPERAPSVLLAAAAIVQQDDPGSAWAKNVFARTRGVPSAEEAIGGAWGAWAKRDYQAVFDALKTLHLDPVTHPEASVLWCATLLKLKRVGQAKDAFAGLPAAKTLSSPLALQAFYETAAELGAWPIALEAAETWASLEPDAPEGYLAASQAAAKLGNQPRADVMRAKGERLAQPRQR